VVDADIKGAFDNISHEFVLKTIGNFPAREWIKQWLKAGYVEEGAFYNTESGTPQGGVVSPILANLFLHYAFDAWMRREMPHIPFCRYADDGSAALPQPSSSPIRAAATK
jgi:retron-type reverse transcriptase